MYNGRRIVVVMPAYNAARTLKRTYDEVMATDIVDLVIVVDDASRDETVAVARTLPHVLLHIHATNLGYGANQKTCYRLALEAGADIVVMIHPDYQYTPRLIPAMAAMLADDLYPCVLGSRILGGQALRGGMPWWKYLANRFLTFAENLLVGGKLSEYHTGYRAFSRQLLERLPREICSDDFVFDNQLLAQILWMGATIAEVSCPTHYAPESSSINLRRSIVYGFGCLRTAFGFRMARMRLLASTIFPPELESVWANCEANQVDQGEGAGKHGEFATNALPLTVTNCHYLTYNQTLPTIGGESSRSCRMLAFVDRLDAAVRRCHNPVLVGLDPRAESLPEGLCADVTSVRPEQTAAAYGQFCRGVIDVVAPLVPAVKPQAAFFEELGPAGMVVLADVIRYASQKGLLVILDGKRNDIGSTATAYAQGMLGSGGQSPWGADALTVSPYLGEDSLQPFVDVAKQRAAGVFVLVKTSNPGGGMLQDLVASGRPVYRHVAEYVERQAAATSGSCGYGAVGAVVGATYPAQLAELRATMPHTWFLVPGFGSQGGTAQDVAAAFDGEGRGAIVNNSRGIIFAHRSKAYAERFGAGRWQEAVEAATRDMIEQLRTATPAGKL